MKHLTKILTLALTAVLLLNMAGLQTASAEDTWNITIWIPKGEDTAFYPEYELNPVLRYIQDHYPVNGKKMNLDFYTPAPGSESENWSNLIATGDYCDIMSLDRASLTAAELYEEEMIWDLTDLVPQYMPNYTAFLEANPQLKDYLYTYVDGEAKILFLRGFSDKAEPNFEGYVYRRDWIAKYGTNPQTGAAFTYGFTDPEDPESWQDDVIFPSGTDEPIYISDWEWMFDIFTKAMAAEGITDGYCFAPFYMGYMQTGDLYTSFGGGAPYWYLKDGKIVNGFTDDNMRAYLQCLNTWYKNGWLDKAFEEHTSDNFFSVDTAHVYQGKVGLWQGLQSTVGTQLDVPGTYTEGIVAYGCRQPINDIYGGDEQKNHIPDSMYQYSRAVSLMALMASLTEEEVIAVLEFTDLLFDEDLSYTVSLGLNAEQAAETPSDFYDSIGISGGAYTVAETENGKVYTVNYEASAAYSTAIHLDCYPARYIRVASVDRGYGRYVREAIEKWDYYEATASIPQRVLSSLTADDNQTITKVRASLEQFQQKVAPLAIKGESYDVWDDASWEKFISDINKRKAEKITELYQDILDSFE